MKTMAKFKCQKCGCPVTEIYLGWSGKTIYRHIGNRFTKKTCGQKPIPVTTDAPKWIQGTPNAINTLFIMRPAWMKVDMEAVKYANEVFPKFFKK